MIYDYDDINPDDYIKSKSQVKREMTALQKLGEKLTELNDKQLATIPLSTQLQEAFAELRRINHREARRRHLQFIGKLMREADHEAIQSAYDKLQEKSDQYVQRQHLVERWRDQLLTGDSKALQDFIDQYPHTDIQHLRQLLRMALKEQAENKPPAHARKLFRHIRETLDQSL
jgi:ribosome-associated protein